MHELKVVFLILKQEEWRIIKKYVQISSHILQHLAVIGPISYLGSGGQLQHKKWNGSFCNKERLYPKCNVVQANMQCVYCTTASITLPPIIHLTSSQESGPKSNWTTA